jgi:hypothetical protein
MYDIASDLPDAVADRIIPLVNLMVDSTVSF